MNFNQAVDFSVGGSGKWRKGKVHIPNTHGLWGTTKGVDVELAKGRQTLWMSTPSQRGVALRWIEMKLKGSLPAEAKK